MSLHGRGSQFACRFPALIADWRVNFDLPDFNLYFIRIGKPFLWMSSRISRPFSMHEFHDIKSSTHGKKQRDSTDQIDEDEMVSES
jgi:hypothetical protein